jgi:predicted nucleic acid-binding protein
MVVIADTSPLNYLVLIGRADILPRLFGTVWIPEGVLTELQHANMPPVVAAWVANPPAWLVVERVDPLQVDAASALDRGESEAIALAIAHLPDVLLLIDEEEGRQEAKRRGIRTTGTLGVLDAAAAQGILDLRAAIEQLIATSFHVSERLLRRLLENDRQRRQQRPSPESP